MKRASSLITLGALILAFAFAVFAQGAYSRLFWLPVAMILVLLTAGFMARLNHGWIKPSFAWTADLPLLLFLGWSVLSWFNSINREVTLFEIGRLALLVAVFFLAAYALPRESQRKFLAFALIVIIFIEAVYGLVEFMVGKQLIDVAWFDLPVSVRRVRGTFRNKNHFAGLVGMGLFLALGLIAAVRRQDRPRTEKIAQSTILIYACGTFLLALILSLSRGAWASFLAGMIFYFGMVWRQERRSLVWIVVGMMIALVLAGGFLLKANRGPLMKRIATIESYLSDPEEITNDTRLLLWKSALDMVQDKPFTGTGWGTFQSAFPSYRPPQSFKGGVFAHNDYLQIAAGMGLPGLIFFLIFIVMVFREGFKAMREKPDLFMTAALPGIMAGLFMILLHESVEFSLMRPANAMFFFAMAGLVAGHSRVSEPVFIEAEVGLKEE
jgi:putative inorganic carbon (HCO3(-)) transporter